METIIDRDLTCVKSFFDKYCERYADRVFLKMKIGEKEITHTYQEFREDICSLAKSLIKKGCTGKHLAGMSENRYEFIVTFFGCLLAGTVFMPVDISAEPEKIVGMLDFADIDIVFSSSTVRPLCDKVVAACTRKIETGTLDTAEGEFSVPAWIKEGKNLPDVPFFGDFSDERIAALCFTSGTSGGKPKCVMLRYKGLFSSPRHNIARFYGYDAPDAPMDSYTPLPMFHLASLGALLIDFIIPLGHTLSTGVKIADCFKEICYYKPTYAMVVPMIAEALYGMIEQNIKKVDGSLDEFEGYKEACDRGEYPTREEKRAYCAKYIDPLFGPLRGVTATGAKTADELRKKYWYLGLRVHCEYGMTEASPQVTDDGLVLEDREGSCGMLCSFNEAKLVDGVLYIRGENIMKGYYKNPEATAAVLSEDGWYCTGDLAEIDEDDYLYIKGRVSSVVVLSNGDNIDTDRLATVFTASDTIGEIILLADAKNNNDTLGALIYPKNGADEKAVAETIQSINRTLPVQQRIIRFRLVDKPFEKNEMMKIKRFLYLKEEI